LGLPELFDEGIKFLDWNDDGRLDLIVQHPTYGLRLFEFDGARFVERAVFPPGTYDSSYGVNVYDLDNDGREDVVTSGGALCQTHVSRNVGSGFLLAPVADVDALCNRRLTLGDLDGDGRIDMVFANTGGAPDFLNQTATSNLSFTIEMLGQGGAHNQFGRVVRVSPSSHPDVVFTRVVDGGSGYMTQTQYALLIGTPYAEPHTVEARYADRVVRFPLTPGES